MILNTQTIQIVCPDRTFPITLVKASLSDNGNKVLNLVKNDTLEFEIQSSVVMALMIYVFYSGMHKIPTVFWDGRQGYVYKMIEMPDGLRYDSSMLALVHPFNRLSVKEKREYINLYKSLGIKIEKYELVIGELSREIGDTIDEDDFKMFMGTSLLWKLETGFCFLSTKCFITLYRFCFCDEMENPKLSSAHDEMYLKPVARSCLLALFVRLELSIDKDSDDLSTLLALKNAAEKNRNENIYQAEHSFVDDMFPNTYNDAYSNNYTRNNRTIPIRASVSDLIKSMKEKILSSPYF